MGISSSKSKTTNDPAAFAKQPILDSLADTRSTYLQNQPGLQAASLAQQGTYNRLAPGAEAGITSAQGVVNDTLAGKYLSGNPFLDKILSTTRANVTNDVDSQFSLAGRYGSGSHTDVLTRALADAENQARYADYGAERSAQLNAVGQAQNLMGGAIGLENNAASLPWVGVNAQNGGTSGLTNGYGTQTKTTSDPVGAITGLGGLGLKAFTTFSDRRLKVNIERLGTLPDGLGVYEYDYVWGGSRQFGVMADEVATLRPEALAEPVAGFAQVDYRRL